MWSRRFLRGQCLRSVPRTGRCLARTKSTSTKDLLAIVNKASTKDRKQKREDKRWWKNLKSGKVSSTKKTVRPEVIQAAVKDQNIEVLQRSLDSSEELQKRRENLLMLACMYKGKKLLDNLIAKGEDPNYTNALGCTPLHYCCVNDFSRGAIHLLEHGASILAQDEMGLTPLHQAALSDSVKCISVLLAYGADASKGDNEEDRPLHTAARMGCYDAAVLLLDHGVDVNAKNASGETALHCAAVQNAVKIVDLLIRRGAAVNLLDKDGMSPLHNAAKNAEDFACVARLIEAGAEVNDTLSLGISPLHLAAFGGNLEAVAALVSAGSAIDYKGTDGWTPLMLAAQEGHLGASKYLIQQGAKVDARNDEGIAALHVAIPHPAIVAALLSAEADVNIKDNNRLTPLHLAAQSPDDNAEVAEMLLDAGADVDSATPEEGLTALHLAASSQNPQIAAALLKCGADVNASTLLGETPLHMAVETQDPDLVRLLCEAGAVPQVRGRRGTPLQLAEKGEKEIVTILRQYEKRNNKVQ